jgi:uncharacterized protein (DUF924 family)
MRDDAPDPCAHLASGHTALARRVDLEVDEGLVEGIVACRTCTATCWLRLLDVDPTGGPLRVYAASGIDAAIVDTYLERGGRASCDRNKGRQEVEALLSNAGPARLIAVCDGRAREVVAAALLGLGERVPLGPWRDRVPPPDDARWFRRAGLDKPAGPPAAGAVLETWIGPAARDPVAARDRLELWFEPSRETDRAIRSRFGCAVAAAALGSHDDWASTARGSLALVILLDQFPRNLWRGSARAFAHDAQALVATSGALARGQLDELGVVESAFLLMPYEHVEDLALQRRGVELYERIEREAPEPWRELAGNFTSFARRHLELIERFGRFPHRNAALGRACTPEERAHLDGGGESFGQSGMA